MKTSSKLAALIALACATMATAQAAPGATQDDAIFVNPDWANSAWYVGGSFARSKFIADKLNIPADMVESRFGSSFKLEGDSVIAYDKSGNKIFSASNPGEPAGFDEALGILVEHYPYKDQILKGTGASGGGSNGGNGNTGGKTISRAQFESLSPQDQSSQIGAGVTITD